MPMLMQATSFSLLRGPKVKGSNKKLYLPYMCKHRPCEHAIHAFVCLGGFTVTGGGQIRSDQGCIPAVLKYWPQLCGELAHMLFWRT